MIDGKVPDHTKDTPFQVISQALHIFCWATLKICCMNNSRSKYHISPLIFRLNVIMLVKNCEPFGREKKNYRKACTSENLQTFWVCYCRLKISMHKMEKIYSLSHCNLSSPSYTKDPYLLNFQSRLFSKGCTFASSGKIFKWRGPNI